MNTWKAKLTDAARLYGKLKANMDANNEQRSRLSAFHVNKCLQMEEEVRSLEHGNFNNDND